MFSSARKILPVLIMVSLFSFVNRGMEVWSGVKTLSGQAFAVEPAANDIPPPDQSTMDQNPAMEPESLEVADTEDKNKKVSEDDVDLDDFGEISPIEAELAKDLVMQRKRLEARETELIQKEALLQAAGQELDRKYQEMVALRKDIEDLLVTQSEEEEKRINSLVKIYENMKAKDAAGIFNTLDLDILVEVISRMSERKVSPILAAMSPERARTVTIMLAEQKSLPELPLQ